MLISLERELLRTLINIKPELNANADLKTAFIDTLLTNHPEIAVQVFDMVQFNGLAHIEWDGRVYRAPHDWVRKVELHVKCERKVDAIKELRGLTGMGLKEAKDYIELRWPQTVRTS